MGSTAKRAGAAACALLAIWLLAPLLPEPRTETTFRVAVYATAAVFFAVVVCAALVALPMQRLGGRRVALLALALAAVAMALNVGDVDVASDLAKVALGCVAGVGVVLAFDRPWWLLPVALCVPAADAWSVFSSRGVTNAVVERAKEEPRWIDWPTVAAPIAGFDYGQFGRIGTTDIVFLALFVAAAARWQLGIRRVCVALVLSFVANDVWVLEGDGTAIPALPILCLAFLAVTLVPLVRDLRADLRGRG